MTRLLKIFALSIVLFYRPLAAFGEYRTLELESLRITIDSDWSVISAPGYFPIRFDIVNLGEAREIQIVAAGQRWFDPGMISPSGFGGLQTGTSDIRQTIKLKRGDRVKTTLTAPIFASNESLQLEVWEKGRRIQGFSRYISTESGRDLNGAPVLFIASDVSPFGKLVPGLTRPIPSRYRYTGVSTVAAGTVPDTDFLLNPGRLPTNWLGYTTLRAVALSPVEWQEMSQSQKDTLLAWTAAGGDLLFFDGSMDTLLPPEKRPAGFNSGNSELSSYFLGHVHLLNSDAAVAKGFQDVLRSVDDHVAVSGQEWALPISRAPDWDWISPYGFRIPMKGVGGIPSRTYLTMLVAFSVIIGPLNFAYLWRKRQQVLLVVTVPLISAIFIAAIGAYGILGEGLSIRAAAATFTVLDQPMKQAATRATVSLYSGGITPSGGLRFPSDLAILPLGHEGHGFPGTMRLDLSNGQNFSSGMFQARSPANFEEIGFRPARERLSFERNGDGLTVVNGLGGDIAELVYRESGEFYAAHEKVPAGQKGTLKRAAAGTLANALLKAPGPYPRKFKQILDAQPDNTYLAILEKSPFWDPGVSNAVEQASVHMVLGYTGGQP